MKKLWFILGLVVAVLCIAILKFLHVLTWLMVVAGLLVLVGFLVGRRRCKRKSK